MQAPQPDPNYPTVMPQPPRKIPQQIAQTVADWCRAGIKIIVWGILIAVALGALYIATRCILWSARLATEALGV